MSVSVHIMFFWYGLSVVFYTAAFISAAKAYPIKTDKWTTRRAKYLLAGLFCFVVGLVGVFGLALMLGIYNESNEYINQSMILGGVVGFLVFWLLQGPLRRH